MDHGQSGSYARQQTLNDVGQKSASGTSPLISAKPVSEQIRLAGSPLVTRVHRKNFATGDSLRLSRIRRLSPL